MPLLICSKTVSLFCQEIANSSSSAMPCHEYNTQKINSCHKLTFASNHIHCSNHCQLLGVLKESPLVCRWFISLSKNDPFSAAVWKASNDVGYSAYHTFMMQHGKQSSFSPVSLQHKMSQNQPLSSNHGLSACSKVAGSKSAEV